MNSRGIMFVWGESAVMALGSSLASFCLFMYYSFYSGSNINDGSAFVWIILFAYDFFIISYSRSAMPCGEDRHASRVPLVLLSGIIAGSISLVLSILFCFALRIASQAVPLGLENEGVYVAAIFFISYTLCLGFLSVKVIARMASRSNPQ
jgi:hypothetical protein